LSPELIKKQNNGSIALNNCLKRLIRISYELTAFSVKKNAAQAQRIEHPILNKVVQCDR